MQFRSRRTAAAQFEEKYAELMAAEAVQVRKRHARHKFLQSGSGVTPIKWRVLKILEESEEPLSAAEVAECDISLTPDNVRSTLGGLVQEGKVKKHTRPFVNHNIPRIFFEAHDGQ